MRNRWLDRMQALWETLRTRRDGWADRPVMREGGFGLWPGVAGRHPEMLEVEAEVAAEQRGRLLLVSRDGECCRLLLARLRQQPPLPASVETICREGFFTLITLPPLHVESDSPPFAAENGAAESNFFQAQMAWPDSGDWGAGVWGRSDPLHMTWEAATEADLLLYLVRQSGGWHAEDIRWIARLRALGAPILPVVAVEQGEAEQNCQPPTERGTIMEAIRRSSGMRPVLVAIDPATEDNTTESSSQDLLGLLDRILALRPRLAIPLAQEVPGWRRLIAKRVIHAGALMTAMVGAEPIPLLDLPLQVALQWKVALQLAAIYGRPGLDYRSREMLGTVLANLCVRSVAQQVLKFVPLVGWLLSATLSGVSTWLLGSALHGYYADDQVWDWPPNLSNGWGKTVSRLHAARQRINWPQPHPSKPDSAPPDEGTPDAQAQ